MPQIRNSTPPPEVMTWGDARVVFAVAIIFDLLRAFFNMFWFFGPSLFAVYCTQIAEKWVSSLAGLTGATCGLGAAVAGAAISSITIPFGAVMAMAMGVLGALALVTLILRGNPRLFKVSATSGAWFGASFLGSELPLLNTLPMFTFTLWRLYKKQIQVEEAAYKVWEKEQADAKQEMEATVARFAQAQATANEQRAQLEADANDEVYGQSEVANDKQDEENPDTERDIPLVHLPVFQTSLNKVQEVGIVQKTVSAQQQNAFHAEVVQKENIAEINSHDNLQSISTEPKMPGSHLSVQENTKKYGAYFVHMFQVTDTLDVSANNKSIDTKKLTGTDRMDILYGVNPTLSASTLRPHTTDRTFQGAFGVILGNGTVESAARTDDGTIATSFESRQVVGGNKDKKEDVERAINRSKESNGYNEVVVKQPSIGGSFMKLSDDDRISYDEESIDYGNFGGLKTRKIGILDMSDIMFGKRVEVSYAAPFNTLLAMKNRGQGGRMFLLNNKNEMLHIISIDEKTRKVKFDTVPVTPEDIVTHFSSDEIAADTKKEMVSRLRAKGIVNK